MKRMGDLLGGINILRLIKAWRECAGPVLLKQTRFCGLHWQGGVLCLRLDVPDPIWRQELQHQKDELLARFNQLLLREGLAPEDCPRDCLLGPSTSMPLKPGNTKKSGYKKRI